jgi:heterodisulfide reductase subunit C
MATQEELHQAALKIGRANPEGRQGASKHLRRLDYSVLQQCIHCGMCLPTCPTYDETKLERNSPRGRIALMRRIADGQLEVTQAFGQELYFCLGCLTCETACPAGVRYGEMSAEVATSTMKSSTTSQPMGGWAGVIACIPANIKPANAILSIFIQLLQLLTVNR